MKRVGAHVSAVGGVANAPANAEKIGAKSFAIFVKSRMRWFDKPFTDQEAENFKKELDRVGIKNDYVLPHGSYLLNLGSPSEEGREKSIKSLVFEMKLCKRLGLKYLNVHPGSHLGEISEEECADNVAESINKAAAEVPDVKVVIENTAGQGGNIGFKIEHLARMVSGVSNKSHVGVCIDTCHAFAAGYDLRTEKNCEDFFNEFKEKVGAKYLCGLHLNDSKTDLGSRRDRHESLGRGKLGWEVFKYIMNEDLFENIPLILETSDSSLWAQEIEQLYSFVK